MSSEPTEKLQQLFLGALEQPPSELESWLNLQCPNDEALRIQVLELVSFHNITSSPVDGPIFDNSIGQRIIGEAVTSTPEIPGYKIQRELARGGQSIVYEAIQESTSLRVAIKVLLFREFSSEIDRRRQAREVQILADLQHPHIVGLIGKGATDSGVDYVVMHFVDGQPIDTYVMGSSKQDNPASTLQLYLKVARAVGFAHRRGVIHRDLKPSNILVDAHGEPRILDFGIAGIHSGASKNLVPNALTIDGHFFGSLPWSAPEQAARENRNLGPWTDVYALGVILYQLLTSGEFPYEVVGNVRDVLENIMSSQPTPPSKKVKRKSRFGHVDKARDSRIHPAIDAIAMKALAKSPKDRYQNADELGDELENYLAGKPTLVEIPENSKRFNQGWLVAAVICICLFGATFPISGVISDAINQARNGPTPAPGTSEADVHKNGMTPSAVNRTELGKANSHSQLPQLVDETNPQHEIPKPESPIIIEPAEEANRKAAPLFNAQGFLKYLDLHPNVSILPSEVRDEPHNLDGFRTAANAIVSGQVFLSVHEFDQVPSEEHIVTIAQNWRGRDGEESSVRVMASRNLVILLTSNFMDLRAQAIEDYDKFITNYGITRAQLNKLLLASNEKDIRAILEDFTEHIISLCRQYHGESVPSQKFAFLNDMDFRSMSTELLIERREQNTNRLAELQPWYTVPEPTIEQLEQDCQRLDATLEMYHLNELLHETPYLNGTDETQLIEQRSEFRSKARIDLIAVVLRHVLANRIDDAKEILSTCVPFLDLIGGSDSFESAEARAWQASLFEVSRLTQSELKDYKGAARQLLSVMARRWCDLINYAGPQLTIEDLQDSSSVFEELVGSASAEYVLASLHLAWLYSKSGKDDKAERVLGRLDNPLEALFGKRSAHDAYVLTDLSETMISQHSQTKNAEARLILEDILPILESHFLSGRGTPLTRARNMLENLER